MKWGKVILVIFGAIIITALGIDASDTLQGKEGTLLSQVISNNVDGCPEGMVAVETIATISCADRYEATTGDKCPVLHPSQILGTQQNLEARACTAESKEGENPWRFITRDQAMQMCARVGKRLPTSEEWYLLSLGMADVEQSCNVQSKEMALTGAHTECSTQDGVYDLVGNAWEWVRDDVIDGVHNTRTLPDSGYVTQVDSSGLATAVSSEPEDTFGRDYFWAQTTGAYGMIRGGYYDSGTDAGLYTVHADTPPTTASIGIGFRCVK